MLITNKILMLSLIYESSKEGWLGITKLQKLSFLMEFVLSRSNRRAFDYEFFMYNLGPISKGVYNDFEFLMNQELVIEDEEGIRLSEFGESIYEQIRDIIPKGINSVMHSVVAEHASKSTRELVETVHRIRIKLPDGVIARIEALTSGTVLLPKPLATCFRVGTGYLETLCILYDKPLTRAVRQARKRGSKTKPYQPLASSS